MELKKAQATLRVKTLKEYLERAVTRAGSDTSLGMLVGYIDGSRIGRWRRGAEDNMPPLTATRLARYMGDNPLAVLTLAGHEELAETLAGHIAIRQPEIVQTYRALDLAKRYLNSLDLTEGERSETIGHDPDSATSGRLGDHVHGSEREATSGAVSAGVADARTSGGKARRTRR